MIVTLRRVRVTLTLSAVLTLTWAVVPEACAQRRPRTAPADANAPPTPQLYKSANFQVMTDLPKEGAEELLVRLETMLKFVSGYYGPRSPRPIEMYVIDNFDHWPEARLAEMDPDGVAMVRAGGGLTLTLSARSTVTNQVSDARSVVYAGSQHGTPQHEAVHAYCGNCFGTTGPVWYSEGMAEVGQYWRQNDDKRVNASPEVIEYLKSGQPKALDYIVNNPLETTGDSWQNYAWRWALCHLLGFNENYTQRFKPLGMALLAERDVDFWQVYGAQSKEIDFEYRLFLKDMEEGYRCDLCSWDWKTRFVGLQGKSQVQAVIRANRGWQASRLKAFAGQTYQYDATGDWKLEDRGDDVSPDGTESGAGRLVGVLFNDYQLSDPIELGQSGTFTAPTDGHLFLRCRDTWGSLADNKGTVTVKWRRSADAPPHPAADAAASATE
jgi:hypothetical protein